MQQLKRVGWQLGQPLLPIHLISQEESLLAHLNFYIKNLPIPFYGIAQLKWDETLLVQGLLSVSKCALIFPSGEMIDVPENGKVATLDLNLETAVGPSREIYLHLLKEVSEYESIHDGFEEEKVVFSIHHLVLSSESHRFDAKASIKLAEFEKDVESRWKLSDKYIPPLLTIHSHPFLEAKVSTIRTVIESFQKELELEGSTGKQFEQKTLETKLCLIELAKMRQLLLNLDRDLLTHPYYLYEGLTHFINTFSYLLMDFGEYSTIPYQHDRLALVFTKLLELLIKHLKPKSDELASIPFEKKQNCYVTEKLPRDLYEAKEVYFIVQPVDLKTKFTIEGMKLASYSRLFNIHRFMLTGITLLRLDSAPFNNNFSKSAFVFKVEKDGEWDHALNEGKLAFSLHNELPELQAYIYSR